MNQKEEHKQKSLVIWLVGIGVLILVVIGVAFAASRKDDKGKDVAQKQQGSVTVLPSDHSKGNQNAKITLIEYSDFQCPACGVYYPLVKQVYLDYKDSLILVSRNFPLKQLHKNAENAAHAAEAAAQQGKFWEMHDLLFERQKEWSDQADVKKIFVQYAKELKLDSQKFENDFSSREVQKKIDADYESGMKAGVNATPSFFLNGKKIDVPRDYQEFRQIIEDALSQTKQ